RRNQDTPSCILGTPEPAPRPRQHPKFRHDGGANSTSARPLAVINPRSRTAGASTYVPRSVYSGTCCRPALAEHRRDPAPHVHPRRGPQYAHKKGRHGADRRPQPPANGASDSRSDERKQLGHDVTEFPLLRRSSSLGTLDDYGRTVTQDLSSRTSGADLR